MRKILVITLIALAATSVGAHAKKTKEKSNKPVFTAKKMQSSEINDVDQVLVVLHAYEPDSSRVVNGTALITRWRKTDNGWKLDMNPYLDNFRSSRK